MAYKLMLVAGARRDGTALSQTFANLEDIACVGPAYCWREARAMLCRTQPDAVLLDVLMPDADAVTMLEDIDALTLGPKKPLILAMSAVSDDRLLLLIAHRVAYCFTKPFQYERVALRVSELIHADGLGPVPQVRLPETGRLDACIAAHIRALGVPAHLKGYYYLRDAVRMYAQSAFPLQVSITNESYPAIAARYGTQPSLVEHAMRSAIEIAWTRGDLRTIHSYFGYTVNDHKGRPSNLEFVSMLADRVRK